MNTKEEILRSTIPILAREGYAGTTMRKIAAAISREPSIIYAHFDDKESLLRETRRYINIHLDDSQVYAVNLSASQLLRETLHFQIDNRESIVALLQYFMASRADFQPLADGYIPERAYAHMTRVIRLGISEGTYASTDVNFDAKTTTHLVNGFLMEYYDRDLSRPEADKLIERLAGYIEAAFRPEMVKL